jgi:hypothetical protein
VEGPVVMLMIIEVESSRLLHKRCAGAKGDGERLDALSANERFAENCRSERRWRLHD